MRMEFCAFLVLMFGALQAEAATVGYQKLLQAATKNSAAIKREELNEKQQQVKTTAVYWQLSPELHLNAERRFLSEPTPERDGTQTSLSARWNLFNAMQDWTATKSAEIAIAQSRYARQAVLTQVVEGLASAYLDWQRAQKKLDLLANLEKARARALKNVKRLARRGEREKTEPLLFENQMLETRDQTERALIDVSIALASINDIVGDGYLMPQRDRPEPKPLFQESHCKKKSKSLARHHTVQSAEAEIASFDAKVSAATWSYGPTLDLRADRSLDQLSTERYRETQSVSLFLSWPLFTGFSSRYARYDALLGKQKASIARSEVLTGLKEAHTQNCRALERYSARRQLLTRIVKNYESILARAEHRYARGETSALDLLDQEFRLLSARLSLIDMDSNRDKVLLQQHLLHRGAVP